MKRHNLNIGAPVICKSTNAGRLIKLVVDPDDGETTDLIVESGRLHNKTAHVVPVDVVDTASDQAVQLSISERELRGLPQYREKEFSLPAPGWRKGGSRKPKDLLVRVPEYGLVYHERIAPRVTVRLHEGVSDRLAVVGRGTEVDNLEGTVGAVDHLLVDRESGDVQHVVVDTGLLTESIVIPISMVKAISERGIVIKGDNQDLQELPRYRPRSEQVIVDDLQARLESMSLPDLKLSVEEGVAFLRGVVPDVKAKRRAEATARGIEGVIDVKNTLTTDTAIAAAVTTALSGDPRTELAAIEVISEHGLITLSGEVDSTAIRTAAEQIAARQQGVIQAINGLEVKPDEDTPFLRPATHGADEEHEQVSPAGALAAHKLRSP